MTLSVIDRYRCLTRSPLKYYKSSDFRSAAVRPNFLVRAAVRQGVVYIAMPTGTVEDVVQRLESKISKVYDKVKEVEKFCTDMNRNMQILHQDLSNLTKRLEESDKMAKDLKGKVEFLEAENFTMKKEVREMRCMLEEAAHEAHANELELAGIPATDVEDLGGMVKKIGEQLSIVIKDSDVKNAYRIKGKNGPLNIVRVEFKDKQFCREVIEKGRRSKLRGERIGLVGRKDFIYFNEVLTPFTRSLFYNARIFRREQGWKYLWLRGGKIFLRKAEKDPAVRVGCMADLAVLKV